MAESEAEKRLKTLAETEGELLLAVQIAEAELRVSRERFAVALQNFNRFILGGLTLRPVGAVCSDGFETRPR